MSRVDDFISYLVWGLVAAYAVGTIGALLALWAFLRCLLLWPARVGATLSLAAAVWLGGYRTRGATRGRRWAAGTCIGVAALCLVSDHLYPGTETAVSASPQSPAPPPPPSVCRRWCRKHEEVWTRKCLCDGGHANVPFGVACDGACSACSECLALQVADATAATADGPRSDLAAAGGVTWELRLGRPEACRATGLVAASLVQPPLPVARHRRRVARLSALARNAPSRSAAARSGGGGRGPVRAARLLRALILAGALT